MNEHQVECVILRGKNTIRKLVRTIGARGFIGGSFAAWAVSPVPRWLPNDIDIFATSDDVVLELVQDIREAFSGYAQDSRTNERVVTLGSCIPGKKDMQIIRPSPEWKVFPDDILNSFDLDICRAIILSPSRALADENAGMKQAKVLRVNNPPRTLRRIMKYQARGVEISDHELLKVFRAWAAWPEARREAALAAAAEEEALAGLPTGENSDFLDEDDWFEGE